MESYLPENEYKEFDGRAYLNPQVSVDETNAFINNLMASQDRQNQQISTDTQRLGTDVPSNLGGLVGGNGYFTSRYQTPQTSSAVANLRAVAQANALNQALANEQEMWKKRYNDAYRNYQKRQYNRSNGGGLSGDGGGGGDGTEGGVDESSSGAERLYVDENGVVIPEATTTDVGAVSAVNAYAGVTGGGKVPTTSSQAGILVDKNGNRTAIKVYPGQGIVVAGGMSYTKSGAKNFLSNWVKNGGQVLNYLGKGGYSTNMIAWDLY